MTFHAGYRNLYYWQIERSVRSVRFAIYWQSAQFFSVERLMVQFRPMALSSGFVYLLGAIGCLGASPLIVNGQLQYPIAVTAAPDGTIFVADRDLPGIWKISGRETSEYFRASKKYGTPLNAIRSLAIDQNGHLLAGDSGLREVYRFGDDHKPVPLTKGRILIPSAIAVRENGQILVADQDLKCIWEVPAKGGEPKKLATLPGPVGISLDAQNRLWVVSRSSRQIRRVAPDGKVEILLGERPFLFPHHIVVDPQGVAFVTDGYGACVWKYSPGKAPEKLTAGKPLVNPVGICRSGQDLLVADSRARAIFRIGADGKATKLDTP